MDINFNDLEAMLRSGKSVDEIASQFTNNLNKAVENTSKMTRKRELCEVIADAWNEYIDLWLLTNRLPRGVALDDIKLDYENIEEVLDGMLNMMVKMAPLYEYFTSLAEHDKNTNKNTADDFDSVMAGFLNKYVK